MQIGNFIGRSYGRQKKRPLVKTTTLHSTTNKSEILNWVWVESLETINKTTWFVFLSPVTIGKSHEKKWRNYFFKTITTTTGWNVAEMWILKKWILSVQQEKAMDFEFCEEYLRSISNKILLWQCFEKQILIQFSFAD